MKPTNPTSKILNSPHYRVTTNNKSPKIKAKVVSSVQLSKVNLLNYLNIFNFFQTFITLKIIAEIFSNINTLKTIKTASHSDTGQ